MASSSRPPKRGRPPKFGRRGRVVAVTLPEEVVRGLKRVHADLGWAIVQMFDRSPKRFVTARRQRPDSELAAIANGRSLIVVNREVLRQLPGVNVIPLHDNRAFLAFDQNATIADLELAVIERMAKRAISVRERKALSELRTHVRRWRRDPRFRCEMRSIIVVERVR